ncbi:hypothetical protein K3495_g13518 [Podosphaera aphanis]|nr:hypothetical protein K3495_g13518 [Podosphaera aphanis]
MEEGTDVEKLANELTQRQSRIAALDRSQRPSDFVKKNRLLSHFESRCSGYYGGTVTFLRNDPNISFDVTVNHLRTSQSGYKLAHPEPFVALVKGSDGKKQSPPNNKSCAHCKRKDHTRDS